jgi:predicted nucleotidyltransferase
VRLFGSVALGKERTDSDVDFLVEFESDRSLVDEIALIEELQAFLERPVDIAEPDALHGYIKDKILSEAAFL